MVHFCANKVFIAGQCFLTYYLLMTHREIKTIFVISLIFAWLRPGLASNVLNCTLNKAADKKTLPISEVSKNVKSLSYDVDKEVGKNIELSPYKLIIWKKSPHLNMKLIGGEFKKPLTIHFSLKQKNLRFKYGQSLDFSCQFDGQTEAQKATQISTKKPIEIFQERVLFEVTENLTFKFNQPEESQMMRTLYFQGGKTYIDSQRMESRLPWCSLRVQLKRNEDTIVNKGEEFSPLTFQKQENNTYFTTFSYSFVDFVKGKKAGEKNLYSPFMLTCNILRGMPYKVDIFKAIVGPFLKVKANL
jgi:hypothetical protein